MRAMRSGGGMFERWSVRFAGYLEQADSVDKAALQLRDLIAKDAEFVQWFENSGLHAWMAGQLMVRGIELGDDEGKPGTVKLASVALAVDPASFVFLPFDEAIEFFASKRVVSPAEFAAVRGRFRAGAFTARHLTAGTAMQLAHTATASAVAGASIPSVVSALRADPSLLGIDRGYLSTVVRTNSATSYNAGRYQAMTDPAVLSLRPYWLYVTAGDERVRDEHQVLEGKMFEADSDEGNLYYPPLGFNCRCSMVSQSRRQFEARGGELQAGPVDGADITAGFDQPPEPLE